MFPFVIGIATFLSAASLNSVEYSYIRVSPSDTTLEIGERFSLDIYAYAHQPVNAVDISVAYSDSAVKILGVDTGQSVITLWTEEPAVKNGAITLRGGTFQRGFRGEHLVATVNVEAKQAGQAEFFISNVQLLAGDGRGTPVLTGKPSLSRADVKVVTETSEDEGVASLEANVTLLIVTDIDGDGKVSLRDVTAFLSAWHSRDSVYDFNSDGKMTFRDFAIILSDSFFGARPR